VEELIKLNPRYELQLEVLKQEYGIKLLEVLPKGEIKPYAVWQSCRGAKFTDEVTILKSWKILSMKCVYKFLVSFGRMDVMYNSFEELENGKTSASEPTHIYDPKHLIFAWKELAQHYVYV
jgi:hypothetical protein